MNRKSWLAGPAFATLLAVVGLPGCGSSNALPAAPVALNDAKLRNVAELYRNYQMNNNKPPSGVDDLTALGNITPSGYEAIRSGEVVVQWGATLPDTKEEGGSSRSDEVLAYLKTVPEVGGPVLMLDRTTRSMTPEQFKAAKLAGGEMIRGRSFTPSGLPRPPRL